MSLLSGAIGSAPAGVTGAVPRRLPPSSMPARIAPPAPAIPVPAPPLRAAKTMR